MDCRQGLFKTFAAVTAFFYRWWVAEAIDHRRNDLTQSGRLACFRGHGATRSWRAIAAVDGLMIDNGFQRLLLFFKQQADGIDKRQPMYRHDHLNGVEVFVAAKASGQIGGFIDGGIPACA